MDHKNLVKNLGRSPWRAKLEIMLLELLINGSRLQISSNSFLLLILKIKFVTLNM